MPHACICHMMYATLASKEYISCLNAHNVSLPQAQNGLKKYARLSLLSVARALPFAAVFSWPGCIDALSLVHGVLPSLWLVFACGPLNDGIPAKKSLKPSVFARFLAVLLTLLADTDASPAVPSPCGPMMHGTAPVFQAT